MEPFYNRSIAVVAFFFQKFNAGRIFLHLIDSECCGLLAEVLSISTNANVALSQAHSTRDGMMQKIKGIDNNNRLYVKSRTLQAVSSGGVVGTTGYSRRWKCLISHESATSTAVLTSCLYWLANTVLPL